MRIEPSAVMWSTPESERAGRPLLVLAHGRGSHEGDLFGLGPHLPLQLTLASVRAPLPEGGGFSWFPPVEGGPLALGGAAVDEAAQALLDWLDTVDTSGGVGILGFSQGAVLGAEALRIAPRRFDYLVAISGFVARETHPGDVRLRELPPPAFWGRGSLDRVIPQEAVEWSIPWFATHTMLTERVYPGLGHGVSPDEIADIAAFLRARIARPGS